MSARTPSPRAPRGSRTRSTQAGPLAQRPLNRRIFLGGAATLFGTALLSACGSSGSSTSSATATATKSTITSSATTDTALRLAQDAWSYDATNNVYYRLGVKYVAKPQAAGYEKIAICVPGKYFKGTKNSNGKYTVTVDKSAKVGGFTAETAPMVLPVNTPGYAAQAAMTEYSYDTVSSYLKAGYIYVHAGLRGKDSQGSGFTGNAPWGVVDLKAAIRYLRYNAERLAGSTDQVYVFGHSGGGAQSAVAGASGNSSMYGPYLEVLGAAMNDDSGQALSDAVTGAMCWCPITNLDTANSAYEWNMGQFFSTGTRAAKTWTKAYSTDLAEAYAGYVNDLGLKDTDGNALTLEKTSEGTYLAGSYYDYLIQVIQDSLDEFFSTTTFPYTPNNSQQAGMGSGAPSGGSAPSGTKPTGSLPSGGLPSGSLPSGASGAAGGTSTDTTTYKTRDAYLKHLNSQSTWVTYDSSTKKTTVKNLKGFVVSQKNPTKDVGAFDGVDRGETENLVMGKGTTSLHFDTMSRDVVKAHQTEYAKLSSWKSSYGASEYTKDFAVKDSVGKDSAWRMNMYNPMYFLSSHYAGYNSADVAANWRIRTGIAQGDTANVVEMNLMLALKNLGVEELDFATVWGMKHTMAETKNGNATTNFIAWVKERAMV